ncbi:hypothetical protein PR048_027328 [Dryococelus australis]|uniref:Uncharacterized protein n=1 Tax=Dryococelus australis TaxID=614101 RepID=A0ABQ9GF57_9NEOP|nr:hypothetical protein PR048_027328 [Dryococelus australis]
MENASSLLHKSPVTLSSHKDTPSISKRDLLLCSQLVDERPIMNAVKYRIVSGVVWTNRKSVSSNTDTNRTGVLTVVDIAIGPNGVRHLPENTGHKSLPSTVTADNQRKANIGIFVRKTAQSGLQAIERPCLRTDPQLNECAKKHANEAIPHLVKAPVGGSRVRQQTCSAQATGEIWAALNTDVLRADGGESWNARAGETEYRLRNPLTSGTSPTCENPGASPLRVKPGSCREKCQRYHGQTSVDSPDVIERTHWEGKIGREHALHKLWRHGHKIEKHTSHSRRTNVRRDQLAGPLTERVKRFWLLLTASSREPMRVIKGRVKRKIPEKTCRPAASSGPIPTCENPGIETGSPRWEASVLIAQPPWPHPLRFGLTRHVELLVIAYFICMPALIRKLLL